MFFDPSDPEGGVTSSQSGKERFAQPEAGQEPMTAQQMWRAYHGSDEGRYDAWQFGDDPDTLAALVLSGKKTATASAYPVYEIEAEPLPEAGQYSVILNTRDEAVCVIRTTKVYVTPFSDVGEEHAFREGEGDRSLAWWRQVHRDFFTKELAQAGLTFTEQMPVVCEEFEIVYKREA